MRKNEYSIDVLCFVVFKKTLLSTMAAVLGGVVGVGVMLPSLPPPLP